MCFILADLLCPLKHPSELPTHPSMSQAYTSKALQDMTGAVEAKLRQERALLWRARNLYREFLGDSSWMPGGAVETPEDRWIFEPKLTNIDPDSPTNQYEPNGISSVLNSENAQKNGEQELVSGAASQSSQTATAQGEEDQGEQSAEKDANMTDALDNEIDAKADNAGQTKEPKAEEVDTTVADVSAHPGDVESAISHVNGDSTANTQQLEQNQATKPEENGKSKVTEQRAADDEIIRMDADHRNYSQEEEEEEAERDAEMQDHSSPAPPRRMTTRAQATTANSQEGGFSNHSVSPFSDPLNSLPAPHPLFLVPDSIRPDANYGLPPNEAEETRRLLWSYIQKQEETVRGFEHMMESLLRACRMKEDVLEWCKAEGHLGEMSDGEDWYDREKLGLAPGEDLKKGADEDEIETVDDSRATGKRGRGRRQ